MPGHNPKIGGRYLTATGIPVEIFAVCDGAVVLQSLASDNRFSIPAGYPLELLRGESAFTLRANLYVPRAVRIRQAYTPVAVKQLAPIIDAMLLAGGKTMRGILRELRRKASASCKGKDLAANVRARLHWFKRKGYRVQGNQSGPRAVAPVTSE